jgi:hypothetical protein
MPEELVALGENKLVAIHFFTNEWSHLMITSIPVGYNCIIQYFSVVLVNPVCV